MNEGKGLAYVGSLLLGSSTEVSNPSGCVRGTGGESRTGV